MGQPQHAQGPFGRCGSVYRVPLLVLDRIFSMYRDFRRFWGLAWYNKCSSLADAKSLLRLELKLENLSILSWNNPKPEYRLLAWSAPAPSSLPKSEIFRIFVSVTCRKLDMALGGHSGEKRPRARKIHVSSRNYAHEWLETVCPPDWLSNTKR